MPSQTDDAAATSQDDEEDRPTVTAHESNPERTVFTEKGNKDGWIATDLTIELTQ